MRQCKQNRLRYTATRASLKRAALLAVFSIYNPNYKALLQKSCHTKTNVYLVSYACIFHINCDMLQPEHLFYGTALMALFSVQNYPIYISFTAKIAPL